MKKNKYILLALALVSAMGFVACADPDEPPVLADGAEAGITSTESVGDVNTTITELKSTYRTAMTSNNQFVRVEDNQVFEGIVVANDVSGNLYQTLLLRQVDTDQFIQVGIKNTHLCPYFPLGQNVRINLKDLYIGNYSYVPKVGQPYYTSAGNLRLGPMLLELCRTKVQLVESPGEDKVKAALTPIEADDSWLASNRDVDHTPVLATVEGTLNAADGKLTFAPYEEHDAGYGVNRAMKVGSQTIQVRTSTRNEVSFTVMPQGRVRITGMLTYYGSEWQLTMRDLKDLQTL